MIKRCFWKNKKKGFSLIELLISIGILFVLFSLVNQWFIKKQRNMTFEIASDEIYNQLYEARENSRYYKDSHVYGIKLSENQYEFFQWEDYANGNVLLVTEILGFLKIQDINLNGWGDEIVFQKHSWKTDHYGSFKFISDDGESLQFNINSQWFIDITNDNDST